MRTPFLDGHPSTVVEGTKAMMAKDQKLCNLEEELKEEINMCQECTCPFYMSFNCGSDLNCPSILTFAHETILTFKEVDVTF
jgi:hypothetical protein